MVCLLCQFTNQTLIRNDSNQLDFMYSKILITPPPGVTFTNPSQARNWLAICDTQRAIPGVLFHKNEAGNSLNEASPFRFSLNSGALEIIAIGTEAATRLLDTVPAILTAIAEKSGQLVPINVLSGECSYSIAPTLGELKFSALVIQSRKGPWSRFKSHTEVMDRPAAELSARVIEVLEEGIKDQVMLCDDQPYPADLVIGDVVVTRVMPVPVGEGRLSFATVFGTARTNLRLTGPWHVGRLHQKGCGHLTTPHGYQNRNGGGR